MRERVLLKTENKEKERLSEKGMENDEGHHRADLLSGY
jgi:hypothetical protein